NERDEYERLIQNRPGARSTEQARNRSLLNRIMLAVYLHEGRPSIFLVRNVALSQEWLSLRIPLLRPATRRLCHPRKGDEPILLFRRLPGGRQDRSGFEFWPRYGTGCWLALIDSSPSHDHQYHMTVLANVTEVLYLEVLPSNRRFETM